MRRRLTELICELLVLKIRDFEPIFRNVFSFHPPRNAIFFLQAPLCEDNKMVHTLSAFRSSEPKKKHTHKKLQRKLSWAASRVGV